MLAIVPIICQHAYEPSAALCHRFRSTTATTSGRRRPSHRPPPVLPARSSPAPPVDDAVSARHRQPPLPATASSNSHDQS
ncbi:hypothetical protein ACLOJK_029283, partial [Asimina triloba]